MSRRNRNQERVEHWIKQIPAQAKDLHETPTIPSLEARILSARLMLEEVFETIQLGLGVRIELASNDEIKFEDLYFCEGGEPNLLEIADGLADQDVVNLGTAARCGIGVQSVFDEVMDNNDLKLNKGHIDAQGKLVKPKDHPRPDIARVLLEQQLKR